MTTGSKRILVAALCCCAAISIYLLAYFRTVQRWPGLPVIRVDQSGEVRVYRFYPLYGRTPEWLFWPAYEIDRFVLRPGMWAETIEKRPVPVRHDASNQRASRAEINPG